MTESTAQHDTASETIVAVGDVVFEPVQERDLTFEQTLYLTEQLRSSGLRHESEYAQIGDPGQRGMTMLADLNRAGRAFRILAAVLKRRGEPWRIAQAETNARLFAESTGSELRNQFLAILGSTIRGVFASGSSSEKTSPSSSSATGTTRPSTPVPISAPPGATMASGTQ